MSASTCWDRLALALTHTRQPIFLYGPPGVGKTHACMNACGSERIIPLSLSDDGCMAELRGHKEIQGGNTVWSDGPAVIAWRAGNLLVVNELEKSSADVQAFLLAILEHPEHAKLTLPTGEILAPSAGFRVLATSNSDPEFLEPALCDRFPIRIKIDEVHPETLAKLPSYLRKGAAVSPFLEGSRRASLRSWFTLADLLARGLEPETAAALVFGPERAPELADAIKLGIESDAQKLVNESEAEIHA